MVPDEAHARASEFGRKPRSTLDAAWASRGCGYLGTLPGAAAYSDNEPLCALLRTKMKYYIVEGDPNCFWTVKICFKLCHRELFCSAQRCEVHSRFETCVAVVALSQFSRTGARRGRLILTLVLASVSQAASP